MAHIVWDWNGTLFDDVDAIVAASNEIFADYGIGPLTLTGFRAVYSRPIWACYERLLGRPLADGEWERLDTAFHDAYHRLMDGCVLAAGAGETLEELAECGHSQSLLSMWRHDRLVPTVERLGIAKAFRRVDGLRPAEAGAHKAEVLVRHLAALGAEPAEVIMIGDSVDDAPAAAHVGARVVLCANGVQGRAALARLGVPVVDRLVDLPSRLSGPW
jgi:phosphoglycolate phosphatase-like HAD superfamily hydrolase